jgi:cell wall-associated NlpC family hydrolase
VSILVMAVVGGCLSSHAASAATPAAAVAGAQDVAGAAASAASAAALDPTLSTVPTTITDGVPAQTLLTKSLELSSLDTLTIPVEAQISQVSAELNADMVRAAQAQRAAQAAHAAEVTARALATRATRAYHWLDAALRAATVRLYMTGPVAPLPSSSTSVDRLADAAAYEDTVLSPQGILDRRRLDLASASRALHTASAAAAATEVDAAKATAAVNAATGQRQQLTAELASISASAAADVSFEHQTLATEASAVLTTSTALQFTPASPLPAPLSTTQVALDWAFAQLGKPYVWGATGPITFDCSGLTQYVWEQAGVAIPRVAEDQDAWTIPVPLSQLMPGDLVFYGTTDIHHVGIYIGGGLMINAPHTGTVVQVSSIWWSDLAGFGRVHLAGVPVPTHQLPTASAPTQAAVSPAVGAVPAQVAPPAGTTVSGSLPVSGTSPTGATTTTVPAAGSTTTTTGPTSSTGPSSGTGPSANSDPTTTTGATTAGSTTSTTVPAAPGSSPIVDTTPESTTTEPGASRSTAGSTTASTSTTVPTTSN